MKLKTLIASFALISAVAVSAAQATDVDYKAAADKYTTENHLTFESGEVVGGVYTFKAKDAAGAESTFTIGADGAVSKVEAPAAAH